MKKIRIAGIAVALTAVLLIIGACTKDFESINTDPNNAGLEKAAPGMLLTSAIESMTDRVHEIFVGEEMGNCWAQHEAKCQYTDEDRYIYRTSVVNATWSSFYAANGMDVQTLYNVAVDRQHNNYQGIALVLKGYISTLLTDMFGPVPYTDAWKGSENTLPAYDSQETIYRDVIAKLETANSLLSEDGGDIEGDILFDNDIMKWKKFANSLRMRLLLRMSAKDAAFVTTEMSKMVADAATYPVFESNSDNAALQYLGSAPNNHPINENRKTRDDHRVSKTLTDMMWTNSPNLDYRICLYAEKSGRGTLLKECQMVSLLLKRLPIMMAGSKIHRRLVLKILLASSSSWYAHELCGTYSSFLLKPLSKDTFQVVTQLLRPSIMKVSMDPMRNLATLLSQLLMAMDTSQWMVLLLIH
ncbi:MAG: SusD/RagB family nutrient-binding outer membrane lipoprotein [Bacteroidales bacterium]|nr:SusD/RagB family nutrient-binding outer membrane lipoprotein [Bacteroidales bacterium]